jgi:hypothetical protein
MREFPLRKIKDVNIILRSPQFEIQIVDFKRVGILKFHIFEIDINYSATPNVYPLKMAFSEPP